MSYLLTRPSRQTTLHLHHRAGDFIANTRLAAMMVYGRGCSSRASAVSATGCSSSSSGSVAVTTVSSNFCLVGLVARVGALEARHEGWFCGAGCASATAEHFDCFDCM